MQTNRTGLKQNNGKVESDTLLGMEEIDESFGIAQNIANIISLTRSSPDKRLNILRLNVVKSRNSETDIAINTRTQYSCALTFGDKDLIALPDLMRGVSNDLDKGCLVSYAQTDNRKESSDIINEELRKLEEGMSENGMNGAYLPGVKQ
jgi:hypothetical protein